MINGSNSKSFLRSTALANSSQVTRGGVSKRVFKPNIPVKIDRSKDDKQEDKSNEASNSKSDNLNKNKSEFDKKNNLKNKKSYIQLEGTFEDVKTEGKSRSSYSNGYAGASVSSVTGGAFGIKGELGSEKRVKIDNDLKRETKLEFGRATKDEDYLSDELEEESLSLNDQDKPISWTSYNKMLNEFSNLNKEENNVEEKLENGRLILMPCIFGSKTGDTGYKLQVLKSGKMRLVDKKSGFTVDLLNTGSLENDAIKEVVELDDDKLLRYGSLTNMDIYSPVRNLNSDYNSILQD